MSSPKPGTLAWATGMAQRAHDRNPTAWAAADAALGGSAVATFETATTLDAKLQPVAVQIIERVVAAVDSVSRTSVAETPNHGAWRLSADKFAAIVARIDGGSTTAGTEETLKARIGLLLETDTLRGAIVEALTDASEVSLRSVVQRGLSAAKTTTAFRTSVQAALAETTESAARAALTAALATTGPLSNSAAHLLKQLLPQIPKEPPFDSGGAAAQTAYNDAIGEAELFFDA